MIEDFLFVLPFLTVMSFPIVLPLLPTRSPSLPTVLIHHSFLHFPSPYSSFLSLFPLITNSLVIFIERGLSLRGDQCLIYTFRQSMD